MWRERGFQVEFEGLEVTFRALDGWPGALTERRERSPFRSTFSQTVDLLRHELSCIQKEDEKPVLEMAIGRNQIRRDGYPYANVRPEHPGVVLYVETETGPICLPCDSYDDWQENLRAIALSLKALRAVDRYGVTKRGEQYRGFDRLPPAGQSTVTMSVQEAAGVVAGTAGGRWKVEHVLASPHDYRLALRRAKKYAHPDVGGTPTGWSRLQDAERVLDAFHGER
jgi:hypothetical protein